MAMVAFGFRDANASVNLDSGFVLNSGEKSAASFGAKARVKSWLD